MTLYTDSTPIKRGDKITACGLTYEVAEVLCQEWFHASHHECEEAGAEYGTALHLDLEFIDPAGGYHHYLSWADGGSITRAAKDPQVLFSLVDFRVRELCIDRKWYTRGTNEEYSHLFDLCNAGTCTLSEVIEVAQDIFEHSDVERIEHHTGLGGDDVLTMIAEELINRAADVVVIR